MSTLTRNGWPTLASTSALTTIRVEGHTTKLRRGPVAAILAWLVRQLHYGGIERVVSAFGWRSAATNRAAGGIANSNHLSGTAIDYNGGRHPYEATHDGPYRSGWDTAQTKAIRALLKFLEGTVAWGIDFNKGFRDAMHFEVRGTAAVLERVAAKIAGGTVHVTVNDTACRPAPTTSSKVKARRAIGYEIRYVEVLWREGRLWLLSSGGNYYAASCTSLTGV